MDYQGLLSFLKKLISEKKEPSKAGRIMPTFAWLKKEHEVTRHMISKAYDALCDECLVEKDGNRYYALDETKRFSAITKIENALINIVNDYNHVENLSTSTLNPYFNEKVQEYLKFELDKRLKDHIDTAIKQKVSIKEIANILSIKLGGQK